MFGLWGVHYKILWHSLNDLDIILGYEFGIPFWRGTFFGFTAYIYVVSLFNSNSTILNLKWKTSCEAKPLSDCVWRRHKLQLPERSQLFRKFLTFLLLFLHVSHNESVVQPSLASRWCFKYRTRMSPSRATAVIVNSSFLIT